MAKINVIGNAVVVTSAMTLEALKTIQKYRPSALNLMGGENNKEVVFCVATGNGEGEINSNGAYFTEETHDEAKKACITMVMPSVTGDFKEYVADKLGKALTCLNALEVTLPTVLTEVQAEKAAVMAAITVM